MVVLVAHYAFVCITAAKVFHLNGCFFVVGVMPRVGYAIHILSTAESVTRQFSTELVCHALWHLWPVGDGHSATALPDQARPFQLAQTTKILV